MRFLRRARARAAVVPGAAVRALRVLAVLLACATPSAGAAEESPAGSDTREIFDRYSDRVVQIRVVEAASGAKAATGSGFAVDADGRVITNYHVVSQVIQHPERYRAQLVGADDATHEVRILGFDVVHDLALVASDLVFEKVFGLGEAELRKGRRIYSLGNPYELGLSIVEGTYNGMLEHSRYSRIHFTGSLNPGMSGGPAILPSGEVVGVNVATAGDQVSFLVPAGRVRDLLARERKKGFTPVADYAEELRRQLTEYQQEYLADILVAKPQTVRLGHYEAPTRLAPHFNCWGDTLQDDEDLFEGLSHECFTEDRVYVSESQGFSIVQLRHRQLATTKLSPARFYELYSAYFEDNNSDLWGDEEDYTEFRCNTRFVTNATLPLKATFCVRRYRKLAGLYDAVLKAAALGHDDQGFETALVLSAVSFENALRISRAYLESIAWKP
jgi:serine protease Do